MRKYNFYQKTYSKYPDLTLAKAKEVGDAIGIDWTKYDLGEFRQGIKEEMEHGNLYADETNGQTKVHEDSYETAGRIALAHLVEVPNYYQMLEDLETSAEEFWGEGEEAEKKRLEWVAQNYQEEAEALKAEGIEMPTTA